jgi:hypothetical protein
MPLFDLFHSRAAAHLTTKSIPERKVATGLMSVDPFREERFSFFLNVDQSAWRPSALAF